EEFLEKLEGVKNGVPGEYNALCPAHDDHEHSFSISNGDRAIVFNCHAGCDFKTICEVLQIQPKDLFYEDKPSLMEKPQRQLVATYNYYDEDAVLSYRVLRYEPKGFVHQMPNGAFKAPERKLLYNLPDDLNAD